METYDPQRIGKRIAALGWNTVYRYGENEVIKFPKLVHLPGIGVQAKMERDIAVGEEFFGEYMLATRVVMSADGKQYALVQPFVHGRVLRVEDLAEQQVAQEFAAIMARHDRLVASGHAVVDFMSGVGFLFGRLRNIFLLDTGHLIIIDLMLLDMLNKPFYAIAAQRQSKIIQRLLDESNH